MPTPIFLDRIDSVPLENDDFSFSMESWLSVLVDTLNENTVDTQNALNANINGLVVPSFTTAQITTLAVDAANGTMWYDTDTNQLKAKVNGVVVVIA